MRMPMTSRKSSFAGRLIACVLSGLAILGALALPVSAQAPAPSTQELQQRSPLGAGPAAADRGLNALRPSAAMKTATPQDAGPLDRAWAWILQTQQRLNRDLVAAVRGLKTDPVGAAFVLAWLSFGYGVLHAAGPGHGKAVISAYVLANERTVKRGILLSFLAAFFQALSALVIVGILSVALKATSLTMKSAEAWIETLSWALVAAVGGWLLYGQLRPIFERRAAAAGDGDAGAATHAATHGTSSAPHPHGATVQHAHAHDGCCDHAHGHNHSHSHSHDCGHDHGHSHDHGCSHGHHHPHATAKIQAPATAAAGVAADHVHSEDCGCGHAHMPSPKDLQGPWSWQKALAIAVSVGIRPCTGAILVLLFAISQGLVWAGVMATFAMALGTAITVSALAALAVGSRELATKLAGGASSGFAAAVATSAGIIGSSLVLLMGVAFFMASLKAPAPF